MFKTVHSLNVFFSKVELQHVSANIFVFIEIDALDYSSLLEDTAPSVEASNIQRGASNRTEGTEPHSHLDDPPNL